MNISKYGLHGKFLSLPGKANELANILLEAAELMKSVNGCLIYLVSLSTTPSDEVYVTEVWENKRDHDRSLSVPGVRELINRAIPLLAEAPKGGQELKIIGGLMS